MRLPFFPMVGLSPQTLGLARRNVGCFPMDASDGSAGRVRQIARLLMQVGPLTVADIAARFRISYATARRDGIQLAHSGQVVRKHGRLLPAVSVAGEQSFQARSTSQTGAKSQIAQRAVQLLPETGTIFVDAGTTCLEVGRLLLHRPGLRVATNSIPLMELAVDARASIIAIGGEVRKTSLALTGALMQPWMTGLHFDAAIIGTAGVELSTGAYTSEMNEAAIKSEALRRSNLRVLVADSEKWNRPSAVHFAPWSAFSAFVTNFEMVPDARRLLAGESVSVHRCW